LTLTVHLNNTIVSQYNHHCKANPVATQAKSPVCGHPLAGIAGSNPTGGRSVYFLWMFMFMLCLCDGTILRQRESHWVCVCKWVWSGAKI